MSEAILARGIGSNESTFDVKATETISYDSSSNNGSHESPETLFIGVQSISPPYGCFMAEITFKNLLLTIYPISSVNNVTSLSYTAKIYASTDALSGTQYAYSSSGKMSIGTITSVSIGGECYRATLIGDSQVNQAASLYLGIRMTYGGSWTGTFSRSAFSIDIKYI